MTTQNIKLTAYRKRLKAMGHTELMMPVKEVEDMLNHVLIEMNKVRNGCTLNNNKIAYGTAIKQVELIIKDFDKNHNQGDAKGR